MVPLLALVALAKLPWDASKPGCPDMCCMAMEVRCLACQFCKSVDEFCKEAPETFGCSFIHQDGDGDHVNVSKPYNLTKALMQKPVYNGTHDFVVKLGEALKFNLSNEGFEFQSKPNPIIKFECNSTDDCDMQFEVVQMDPNKTCMVTFEDLATDATSDDLDFEFVESGSTERKKTAQADRDQKKKDMDKMIADRLKDISILKEVPESGKVREKAERIADFLTKSRENKDMMKKGMQAAQKLFQTRRVRKEGRSKLMRLISSCFDDEVLNENTTNATFKSRYRPYNFSGYDIDSMGIPKIPDKPPDFEWPGGGNGPFKGGGLQLPQGPMPWEPFIGRRLSEAPPSGNGNGGMVPTDPSPPSPSPSPPPPVPFPPPSPPQHPSPPPTTDDLAYSIHFTITASGTIDAFIVDEYKASLSTAVNIHTSMISVNVTAASVRVSSTIHASSTSAKDVVVAVLQPLESDTAAASTLLGVTVESVDPVTTTLATVSPPPASPPDPDDDTNENTGVVIIVGLAIVTAISVGVGVGIFLMPRRAKVVDEKMTLFKDAARPPAGILPPPNAAGAAGFAGDGGEVPILFLCKA